MQEAITSVFLADADLTAMVGDRVHWVRQIGGDYAGPYVNLRIVSDDDRQRNGRAAGPSVSVVQADCWAARYSEAVDVARAVSALVQSKRYADVAGFNLTRVVRRSWRDMGLDERADGASVYRVSIDFEVAWTKAEGA